jgi:hypothetical protein
MKKMLKIAMALMCYRCHSSDVEILKYQYRCRSCGYQWSKL